MKSHFCYFWVLLYGCFQMSPVLAQVFPNIVPNGSFEQQNGYDCKRPIKAWADIQRWYGNGTPHLIVPPCEDRWNGSWIFWDPLDGAYDEVNYVGMGTSFHKTGLVSSVSIGVELDSMLDAGQLYGLRFAIRPRGIWHTVPDSLMNCEFDPAKRFSVFLGADTINTPAIRRQARRIMNVYHPDFQSETSQDWRLYEGCFTADGTERHLALAGSIDSVHFEPPCRPSNRDLDYFHTSFYDVDKIEMIRIPASIERSYVLCRDDAQWVDLRELWTAYLLDSLVIIWDDGYPAPTRRLYDAGTYTGRYQLPCGEVPFAFHITRAEICEPTVFAPTAFTPNQDGFNEGFLPIIRVDVPLAEYHLRIYNRWGRQVFESRNPGQSWGGWNQGNPQKEGAYAWALDYAIAAGERYQLYRETGTVLLLR